MLVQFICTMRLKECHSEVAAGRSQRLISRTGMVVFAPVQIGHTWERASFDECKADREIAFHGCPISTPQQGQQKGRGAYSHSTDTMNCTLDPLTGVVQCCTAIGVLQVYISPRVKQGGDHRRILLLRLQGGALQCALRCARAVKISEEMDFQLAGGGCCMCRISLAA